MPFPFPFTMFGANRSSNTPSTPSCDFTYCYGGDWVQGKVGNYGVKFDKSNQDYIDITTGGDLGFTTSDDFTIACWVSSSTGESTGQAFVSKAAVPHNGYILGRVTTAEDPDDDDEYYDDSFTFTLRNAGSYVYLNTTASISDGWHHVAAVRRNSKSEIWLDGALNREAGSTTNLGDSGGNALVGKWWTYNAYGFLNGKIDEVGIWDVALTSSQISALYNSGDGARADSITPPAASDGAWATGANKKIGTYAIGSFNGSSDYLSGSWDSNIDFEYDDPFTYSYWVKTSTADLMYLLNKADYASAGTNIGIINYMASGLLYFQICNTASPWSSENLQINGTHTAINDGNWHHVAFCYDGTNAASGMTIYVDGAAASSTVSKNAAISTTIKGKPLHFGHRYRSSTTDDAYYTGYVDDMAIWNVELDSGAVAAVSSSGASGDGALASGVSGSNLKAYWSCEADGPGNSTISGTNSLDMTMMGGMSAGTTGSLLMYYDFEIGDSNPVSGNFPTSDTIYDVDTVAWKSPTMHTGTMGAAMSVADFGAWDQGKIGKYSLNFSGTANIGDSVEVANNSAINFTGDMTVAGWVYSSNQAFLQGFVAKEQSAGDTHNGWILGRDTSAGTLSTGNEFYWTIRNGSYDAGKNVFSDAAGPNGGWAHLVGTRRNGDNYLYVNGVQQADTSNQSTIGATTCALRLGQWWDQSDAYPLVGNLDEVSIWSGSLSDANIDSLHSGSKANAITPTVADAGNWVTGKIGDYALEFDGSSEVVNVASGSGLSTGQTPGASGGGGSESFTVSAWVYQDTWTTWDSIIARKNGTWYNGWGLTSDGGTTGKVCFWFGGFNSSAGNKSYATISTGQWHHLVGTYDPSAGSNGQVQIWVDGVAQTAADRWVNASAGPDTGQTEIGEFWDGKIDDIGCWNVVLDSGAIAALSGAAASSVSSSNLTSYWSFDSGGPGSSTLTDSSTLYTNNGTLSGMSAGTTVATLAAYYDFECNGPGNSITKDLSGNDLSGTLTKMKLGTCGSG